MSCARAEHTRVRFVPEGKIEPASLFYNWAVPQAAQLKVFKAPKLSLSHFISLELQ